jgi:hypothetical protein
MLALLLTFCLKELEYEVHFGCLVVFQTGKGNHYYLYRISSKFYPFLIGLKRCHAMVVWLKVQAIMDSFCAQLLISSRFTT